MRRVALALAMPVALALAGCAGAGSGAAREAGAGSAGNSPGDHAPGAPLPGATSAGGSRGTALERREWVFAETRGIEIRTPRFVIRTTSEDALLRSRLPVLLEAAHDQYTRALGPLPAPVAPLETYVLASRTQWTRLARQMLGASATPYLNIARGGFAAEGRALLYDIGAPDTLLIAAHEGWHQYTQRTFRDPLPLWLEEGVASYMEGHRWDGPAPVFMGWSNPERFDELRAAMSTGRLLPLRDLLQVAPGALVDGNSAGALVYYAQAWALVHYLREECGPEGPAALSRLLADAADGRLRTVLTIRLGERGALAVLQRRTGTAVFEAYFGEDLSRHEAAYRAFVERIVRPGARDRIVAGLSPAGGAPVQASVPTE